MSYACMRAIRMHESFYTHGWMCHVSRWILVTRMHESCYKHERCICHLWMSHITYGWVICHICLLSESHTNETHMNESHMNDSVTYEYVICHIWMRHIYDGCLIHTFFTRCLHISISAFSTGVIYVTWMSHVTHMNVSCLTHNVHTDRAALVDMCYVCDMK